MKIILIACGILSQQNGHIKIKLSIIATQFLGLIKADGVVIKSRTNSIKRSIWSCAKHHSAQITLGVICAN